MDLFSEIKKPVEKDFIEFEKIFDAAVRTEIPLLNVVMRYMIKRKGKQIRPLFVMYAAKLFGEISEKTYRGAALVELLHTATLIHDDVVDNSYERRGFFSINALWKNKISVLAGDFILSRGLLLSIDNSDFNLLKIVSEAVREMSEGEILQMEKARRVDINEALYFDIIRKKTASLIASCCAVGAASAGTDEKTIIRMKELGYIIGTAFQIKDDLLDFDDGTGKTKAIDLKEKKLTLPVIYALNKATDNERRKMLHIIKNDKSDKNEMNFVIENIKNLGGFDYAKQKLLTLKNESLELLNSFPQNDANEKIKLLVDYIIERKK